MKKLFILAILLGLGQLVNCPYRIRQSRGLPLLGVANADDADMFTVTIQPDVMIILDLSGSMIYDMNGVWTWGDGSADYPGIDTDGDGFSNDSRLFIAKGALNRMIKKREMFRWGFETFPEQEHT